MQYFKKSKLLQKKSVMNKVFHFLLLFFKMFYTGVSLINNVVLVSGVQQNDLVIQVFFFNFFSHLGYYRISSRVPCAIQ